MFIEQIIDEMVGKNLTYSIIERGADDPIDDFHDRGFLKGYLDHDKTALPEAYAKGADRIIIKDNAFGRIAGGILFVRHPYLFRTPHLAKNMTFEPPPDSIEINGLWVANTIPKSYILGFWALVCEYLCKQKAHSVYFSYDTEKKGLDAFYKWLPGRTVYEGPVKAIEGMPGEALERIACFDTDQFALCADKLLMQKLLQYLKGLERGR